jgi:hypothetical protein
MNKITYSFRLNGIITDSTGESISITEDDVTHIIVKDPRGSGEFVIQYVEDEP